VLAAHESSTPLGHQLINPLDQEHLAKISGGSPAFPLCNTTDTCFDATAPWWAVGTGAALAVGLPASTLDGLGLEGFVVKAAGDHGSFALCGGTTSARGAIYAVNHVLRALGVEFFAHDVTTLPPSLPAAAPAGMEASVVPALEYRQQYEFQCLTDDANETFSKFESHLGMNRGSTPLGSDPKFGGVVICKWLAEVLLLPAHPLVLHLLMVLDVAAAALSPSYFFHRLQKNGSGLMLVSVLV
jgi:hypothetical protein